MGITGTERFINMSDNSQEELKPVIEPKNITEWENEPSVGQLKANYTEAQDEHQKQVTKIDAWIALRDGARNFTPKKGKSKVVPKVVRKQAEWRYSSLSEPFLSADDMYDVRPVTFEDKEAAIQNALVLNNQMNTKINKIDFIDEYVRTCVDEGTVIVKVEWEFDSRTDIVEKDVIEMQPILDNEAARAMIQSGQEPLEPIVIGTELVEEEIIVKNQPALTVCDYNHVIIDPTAKGNIEKASFIIYRFEASYSDLKKDPRYSNLDEIHFETDNRAENENEVDDPLFRFEDKPRKKVWVYEYHGFYDIHDTGIVEPFIGSWIGNTKVRMEENPMPDQKLPFIRVQYLPVRKKNYGQPDGYLLEENQNIVGATTRGMIDIMARSSNAQQGVRKDALDTINRRRFEQGDDYQFNTNVDPRQAFHMGVYPEIPNSAMLMINYQNSDAESLTGVKAFAQGITGEALGSNVTNGRSALDAASKRELGILRRLADGIIQIGRKFISMNSEFLDEEEIIRITNDEFIPVRRDDLAGNFDLRLTITTAEADNAKAQELAFMLQTGAASADPGEVRMIRAEIARLRKMPDLAKRIEEYQPQPDPLAVEEAELKNELLKAQIKNEYAKGRENEVDVGLKTAKTVTEQAKARDLNSGSDQKDLDFMEQDTGIAHGKSKDLEAQKQLGALDQKAADALLQAGNDAASPKTPEADIDTSFLDEFTL